MGDNWEAQLISNYWREGWGRDCESLEHGHRERVGERDSQREICWVSMPKEGLGVEDESEAGGCMAKWRRSGAHNICRTTRILKNGDEAKSPPSMDPWRKSLRRLSEALAPAVE